MCRLYGFRATHPTTPSCELIDAQNSLLRQAAHDERGWANRHGWGIVERTARGELDWDREPKAADQSEEYRREVTDTPSVLTIAHIRRATVGEPQLENCHPFVAEDAALAHNGTVGAFDQLQERLVEAMGPEWAGRVQGSTDSEHVFALLMARLRDRSRESMVETLSTTIRDLDEWTGEIGADLGLNLLWMVEDHLVGCRWHRSLHASVRDHAYRCPVCGDSHGPEGVESYRAVVVASEPITANEDWSEVPDETLWWVGDDWSLQTGRVF